MNYSLFRNRLTTTFIFSILLLFLISAIGCSSGSQTSSAPAIITSTQALAIYPAFTSVGFGGTVAFYGTGGSGSYSFSLSGGTGTISSTTGVYVAPQIAETDTVVLTDTVSLAQITTTVTVSSTGTVLGTTAASISGTQVSCLNNLCTFDVSWQLGNSDSYVVTVYNPTTGTTQLNSCGTSSGSETAPWIGVSGTGEPALTFNLYDSTNCSATVGDSLQPVAQTTLIGTESPTPGTTATITGTEISCSSPLCTFQINWQMTSNDPYVLVIYNPNTGQTVLNACGNGSGSETPPWIPDSGAGLSALTFYLYDSPDCSATVGNSTQPLAQGTFIGQ